MSKLSMLFVAVAVAICVCSPQLTFGQPAPTRSAIEAVTVYRGQALIRRAVQVPPDLGELQIIVDDLPAKVVGASLSASGTEGVVVRLVRYRSRAASKPLNKELAEIESQIKQIKRELHTNAKMHEVKQRNAQYMHDLAMFITSKERATSSQADLDADGIAKLTDLILSNDPKTFAEMTELEHQKADLEEELHLLERKRSELSGKSAKAVHEAIIFLTKAKLGPAEVRLNYLVNDARWSPAYNVRLGADGKTAQIEYLADVRQRSGEDWASVSLTLSTATPHASADSPLLVPLWVGARRSVPASGKVKRLMAVGSKVEYQRRAGRLRGQQAELPQQMAKGRRVALWNANQIAAEVQEMAKGRQAELPQQMAKGRRVALWNANQIAAEVQEMELNVDRDVLRSGIREMRRTEEALTVSYVLEGKMSLASRPDRQLLQIASLQIPVETYHQAIPLLTTYVYRMGRLSNTSPLSFLPGPYSAYVGGEFVGKGRLPLIARGQNVALGFGVDTQLRCRRELVDKSDKTGWGSRVQNFSYKLQLENYKDTPVSVRLLDRIPATKSEDLQIKVGKMSDDLSTDPLYVREMKGRGILRWDIDLPAGASGPDAKQVTYSFELKFAKDKDVSTQTVNLMGQMEAEYERMLSQ